MNLFDNAFNGLFIPNDMLGHIVLFSLQHSHLKFQLYLICLFKYYDFSKGTLLIVMKIGKGMYLSRNAIDIVIPVGGGWDPLMLEREKNFKPFRMIKGASIVTFIVLNSS